MIEVIEGDRQVFPFFSINSYKSIIWVFMLVEFWSTSLEFECADSTSHSNVRNESCSLVGDHLSESMTQYIYDWNNSTWTHSSGKNQVCQNYTYRQKSLKKDEFWSPCISELLAAISIFFGGKRRGSLPLHGATKNIKIW